MSSESMQALVASGERADLEFKTGLSDRKRIVETVAAMATIGGGVILVGIRPDGEMAGFTPGEGELERLVQRVLGGTDPRIYVQLDWLQHDGARVLRISVPAGDGPHLAFGRAFYRSGPATVSMSRDEYERRLLDRLRESSGFERVTLQGYGPGELDPDRIVKFMALAGDSGRIPTDADAEGLLERLHLCRASRLNHAALLLFGREPQGPMPQATIRARAQRGLHEAHAVMEGSVMEQIEAAADFVARNLRTLPSRDALRRRDRPELPLAAVREVIANAVAHRDYRSTAPVQLDLNDERLRVWNPGHLPSPITPALLRADHPSVPTNPLLARALYLAGYIEQWGTGTLRVIETMRAAGCPEPLFVEESAGVRVSLPLPGVASSDLNPRQHAFLSAMEVGAVFTTAAYATQAGVAGRTALLDIRGLADRGLVRMLGRGKATRWVRV